MKSRPGRRLSPHNEYDLSDADWGRAAGLVEGEGCITVAPNSRPYCVLTQRKSLLPVIWLRDTFGGPMWQDKFGLWKWKLCPLLAVEDFLVHIEPYLWAKQIQAQLALEILQRRISGFPATDRRVLDLCRQVKEAKATWELPEFAEFYDNLPPTYSERTGKPIYVRKAQKLVTHRIG